MLTKEEMLNNFAHNIEEEQIGRASCRERGVDLGGRRIIKKKKKFVYEYTMTRE